jgi:Xaa-Pro dipeptidase
MSSAAESSLPAPPPVEPPSRRADVEAKQDLIAKLLADAGCDGLFVLDTPNFRWLTSGAEPRGLFAPAEAPALYFSAQGRWLLCNSLDSQRFFDEELDGLGFQLKEWPWQVARDDYLADLAVGRRTASDVPFRDCQQAGVFLERQRRLLSAYEQEHYRELGRLLVHALEATTRAIAPGDTEEEVAGHLSHRLLRHGVEAVSIQVAADERARRYRRHGFTSAAVQTACIVQATAAKFGLFATACRSVCFGEPTDELRHEFDLAVRLSAVYLALARPGEPVATVLDATRQFLAGTAAEHDWRLAPLGYLTGRAPAEAVLKPNADERFTPNTAIVWQARLGAAAVCDTFLVGPEGFEALTPAIGWPACRVVVQGKPFDRPAPLRLAPSV